VSASLEKMKEKDDSIIKPNQKITALETQLKSKEEEIREMKYII